MSKKKIENPIDLFKNQMMTARLNPVYFRPRGGGVCPYPFYKGKFMLSMTTRIRRNSTNGKPSYTNGIYGYMKFDDPQVIRALGGIRTLRIPIHAWILKRYISYMNLFGDIDKSDLHGVNWFSVSQKYYKMLKILNEKGKLDKLPKWHPFDRLMLQDIRDVRRDDFVPQTKFIREPV